MIFLNVAKVKDIMTRDNGRINFSLRIFEDLCITYVSNTKSFTRNILYRAAY